MKEIYIFHGILDLWICKQCVPGSLFLCQHNSLGPRLIYCEIRLIFVSQGWENLSHLVVEMRMLSNLLWYTCHTSRPGWRVSRTSVAMCIHVPEWAIIFTTHMDSCWIYVDLWVLMHWYACKSQLKTLGRAAEQLAGCLDKEACKSHPSTVHLWGSLYMITVKRFRLL